MEGKRPVDKLGVASLHYRASRDAEVLAARRGTTTVTAYLFGCIVLGTPAPGADWAIWPTGGLKPPARGVFLMKMEFGELILAIGLLLWPKHYQSPFVVSTT